MHIGENIKCLREKLNMTQLDFAEKIGVSRSAISYIEKKDSVDTKLLENISEAFNISVIDLFYGDKSIQPDIIIEGEGIYEVKTVRDLHKNNSEMYRKLSDSEKNFSRSIALEIYKEVKKCEEEAIDDFAKKFKLDIKDFINGLAQKLSLEMGNSEVENLFTYSKVCELIDVSSTNWKKNNRQY